jgi:hypothetical protein
VNLPQNNQPLLIAGFGPLDGLLKSFSMTPTGVLLAFFLFLLIFYSAVFETLYKDPFISYLSYFFIFRQLNNKKQGELAWFCFY